ncbi:MAG: phenylalanine--tRNA ligase subunit alpha, partial [Dehalococcoidia bacterium]|nr:phenylalanine--tRNA ligase subunit alpha [Dehalococcoidia bacterium]
MPDLDPRIEGLRTEALAALASASDEAGLEQWRITFFGRQDGRVSALLRAIRDVPADQRAAFGAAANAVKVELEGALEARQEGLKSAALKALTTEAALDVT